MEKILSRFLKYIAIDTESDPQSETVPSAAREKDLGRVLLKDLQELGISNAHMDENGYVYGSIEGNIPAPAIGFIAHMDTAPVMAGQCCHPQLIENYNGGHIQLGDYQMGPEEFPSLRMAKGKTLVTTDGNSLLGGDDKAGIAVIMDMADYVMAHPEFKHGPIRIGFTPDEEIGRGADHFDVEGFQADFAYTVDGSALGELQYENFNAAEAKVTILGKSVHPGTAKNIMVNAIDIANEFLSLLPAEQKPQYTEGREGFFFVDRIEGDVEKTEITLIVRDHDREKFESKKAFLQSAVDLLKQKHGDCIRLKLRDEYYNMKEKLDPHPEIIQLALDSMEELGIQPNTDPIRGGTDGALLSYKGLPTPNLFMGAYNEHGRYEYVVLEDMQLSSALLLKILEKNASQAE